MHTRTELMHQRSGCSLAYEQDTLIKCDQMRELHTLKGHLSRVGFNFPDQLQWMGKEPREQCCANFTSRRSDEFFKWTIRALPPYRPQVMKHETHSALTPTHWHTATWHWAVITVPSALLSRHLNVLSLTPNNQQTSGFNLCWTIRVHFHLFFHNFFLF